MSTSKWGKKRLMNSPTLFAGISGNCICWTHLPRSRFCLSPLCSACPCHYQSTLVSQSTPTLLMYHKEVLTAFLRDNFMTSLCAAACKSVLPWSSSAISFGIILPYPAHALSCLFPAMLLVCSGLLRLWSCPAYYCPGLVLFFPGFVSRLFFNFCFGHSFPVQSRPALAFPWPAVALPALL